MTPLNMEKNVIKLCHIKQIILYNPMKLPYPHLEVFELHGPDCVVGEDLLALELHLEEAVGDPGVGADVLGPVHVALAPAALLRRYVKSYHGKNNHQ